MTRSSASSGTQTVWADFQIRKWVPGCQCWQHYASTGPVGRFVAPGQKVLVEQNRFIALGQPGHYKVTLVLVWTDTASGRTLGSVAVAYDRSSDYGCLTDSRRLALCQTGPGFIQVG